MSKKRTFSSFLATSGTDGIKRLALEYATEDDTVTLVSIAQKYNMSSKTMKKIFEYAIVNCLVSYQTAKFMQTKAHRNQTRHLKEEPDNTPSDKYYNGLLERRLYTVKKFSDKKVKEIVDLYINSPQLSAASVAESAGLSVKELNLVLKKAIIFNIVDDECMNKLFKISLDKVPDHRDAAIVSELLRCYKRLRITYNVLNSSICQLYFQLETYMDFVSSDQQLELPIEDLRKQLKVAEDTLEEFKSRFYL